MSATLKQLWIEDDGVLAFEWVLLLTLLTIGIVGGVAGGRNAIIDELGDTAQVMLAVDQSYTITFPLAVSVHTTATSSSSDTSFTDALFYLDCDTTFPEPLGQEPGIGIPIEDFFPDGA
jgi:Flp pilus assembly pilin Flp